MTPRRLSTSCITWKPLPTSKAGSGFYVTTKYIGEVKDYDTGEVLASTGKCARPSTALKLADKLLFALLEADKPAKPVTVDALFSRPSNWL